MALDELRDEIYWWSLNLVKSKEKDFRLAGIFLLLSTWNFANFRYAMTRFRLNKFEKLLERCEFDFFKKKRFENADLSDQKIITKIKGIYSSLSKFEGVKYVGASKIMHLMNPNFFMMWDTDIREHYKTKTTPEDYVDFMRLMQKMWKDGKFPKPREKETIPRTIDNYNWKRFVKR